MFRYKLRTLLILLAVGPPMLAGAGLLFMSPDTRPALLNVITFAACIAALTWLWVRWPELVDYLSRMPGGKR